MSRYNNILIKILIVLFIGLLVLPNIVMILGLERKTFNNENRKYREFPKIDFNKPRISLGVFKDYYAENFGLKTSLVNNYIDFKSNVLFENPIPNRVVIGKEDWMFLGNHSNNVLNNSFGNDYFKNDELEKIKTYLGSVKKYLAKKGIAFYVVIPSDKNRIYQEYLPYQLNQSETKLETLGNYLTSTLELDIIDLYNPLVIAKEMHPTYIRNDTHWNDYGAFIGYGTVMDKINESFEVNKLNLSDYNIIKDSFFEKGDITKMINSNLKANRIKFSKKTEEVYSLKNSNPNLKHYINPNKNLKLMMYRDSFSNAWIPFFNETFGECMYIKSHNFNKSLIESYKPDIVVFEIIERNISTFSRSNMH